MRKDFDVIVFGGSYAGLSASMALGRSLRTVLIIDSGSPCNAPTPHSHNFITHDGNIPSKISEEAKNQVLSYPTVNFVNGLGIEVRRENSRFRTITESGESFDAKKILFATGLKDIMPPIPGFAECWGISVLHCPYCHGYEVRNEKTGIIANGEIAFELTRMINHWTKDLTLFTDGPATLSLENRKKIESHGITVEESEIESIEHHNGYLSAINLRNGSNIPLKAIYARPVFVQHCPIPETLGCERTEQNLLKVDMFQRTTVKGIYAAGDNCSFRAVSVAVATGAMAGAAINKELIEESF
jgi:thioredoxin reductase